MKLNLVIKYHSEIKVFAPSELDRENQLDQLIYVHLSYTLEDVEECYKDNFHHQLVTIDIMLKIHDDMIFATNEMINETHVRHEKQIQWLKKETLHKDTMNMVMQEVLNKFIYSA